MRICLTLHRISVASWTGMASFPRVSHVCTDHLAFWRWLREPSCTSSRDRVLPKGTLSISRMAGKYSTFM